MTPRVCSLMFFGGDGRTTRAGRISLVDFRGPDPEEIADKRPRSVVPEMAKCSVFFVSRTGLGQAPKAGNSCTLHDAVPHQGQSNFDLRWSGRLTLPPGPSFISRGRLGT